MTFDSFDTNKRRESHKERDKSGGLLSARAVLEFSTVFVTFITDEQTQKFIKTNLSNIHENPLGRTLNWTFCLVCQSGRIPKSMHQSIVFHTPFAEVKLQQKVLDVHSLACHPK